MKLLRFIITTSVIGVLWILHNGPLVVAAPDQAVTPAKTVEAATSQARYAIQAAYERQNAAIARKDIKGLESVRHKNFVASTKTGQRYTTSQLRAEIRDLFEGDKILTAKATIHSFSVHVDKASVMVNRIITVKDRGPRTFPAMTEAEAVTVAYRDVWQNVGGRWLLKESVPLGTWSKRY
jgi:hypothetical protein